MGGTPRPRGHVPNGLIDLPEAGDRGRSARGRQGLLTSVPGGAAAGLYVPSFEPGHLEHELTQKIRRSKVSRAHDQELAHFLAATAVRHFPDFRPGFVVSIPAKPARADRFRHVRAEVARRFGATDALSALSQMRVVDGYREMPIAERTAAAPGCFEASYSLRGRSVLLIDDVVTSGAQANEAIRALKAAGAADVRFVAVAAATSAPTGDVHDDHTRFGAAADARKTTRRLPYDHGISERIILEVVSIEALPIGERGSRRALVRWSDGSVSEALRWWDDEVLFSEGDHGNSRLMSAGVRMPGVAGRSARRGAHNR